VRGLAHIGVVKALAEAGIRPAVVTGTSAGSLIGAAVAAGMGWEELAEMARTVFWPGLLDGRRLERFCARHLPETFADLRLPFAAMATRLPSKEPVTIGEGRLASAISASCAQRVVRRPVVRDGERLRDGGTSSAPSARQASDVLVTPSIPAAGYVPGARAVERMIAAGERAAWRELERLGMGAAA